MLSVILPTYNRADVLRTSLERLSRQKGVEFEVIVMDDGSIDDTEAIVNKFQALNSKFQSDPSATSGPAITSSVASGRDEKERRNWKELHYLHQANSGQAVARNRGVREAKGELVLFFQDDTFAIGDDFLKQHVQAHQKHPEENVALLGYTTWDPALELNNYMRFLEKGWQFNYPLLKAGFVQHPEPYKFFYTSNLSLKKSFFEKERFNETFQGYGWEDMELGYRLWKKHGMRLFYEPQAAAHHHHPIPEKDLSKKMQKVGQSAVYFQALHPELAVVPTGWKRGVIWMATLRPSMALAKLISKSLYFKVASWAAFFVGVKQIND